MEEHGRNFAVKYVEATQSLDAAYNYIKVRTVIEAATREMQGNHTAAANSEDSDDQLPDIRSI